ncbi:DNA/RNA non-specific endonuclease [Eupransor demetentiae]|uniref:Contains Zn-binding and two AraC-type DNA-binding domains (AdaA) n=1 Tax=Eupransor demetentiae TaxID=3109584 RepID=A0ABM9N5E0_9LACO|nr:Methylphosphotriester-DNA--protein-cysteine methyltransferase (N-terminal fragment of Ada) [Lactobacillaceae bacterium LMG 33000]
MNNNSDQDRFLPRSFVYILIGLAIVMLGALLIGHFSHKNQQSNSQQSKVSSVQAASDQDLLKLKWDGTLDGDIVHINGNKATFSDEELQQTFPAQGTTLRPTDGLALSPLDSQGRSQQANFRVDSAAVAKVTKRPAKIPNSVRPSGWFLMDNYNGQQRVGGYHANPKVNLGGSKTSLWNKSHIVGYQFFGMPTMVTENMTTGTRVENAYPGQLDAEDDIRYALKQHPNIAIRGQVTPLYEGNDRIMRGVHYMAKSVQDNGQSLNINYWIFNVCPGVTIDYATGKAQVQ